jgi:outer membrane protein TolC
MLIRDPSSLPRARIPADQVPPPTVSNRPESPSGEPVYLDNLIRLALSNAQVVRVLSGSGAASTGQTIYDPAIANTRIDQQQATFDPTLDMRHDFLRNEVPFALPVPGDPNTAAFEATQGDIYDMSLNVAKQLRNGARADVQTNVLRNDESPAVGFLNPTARSNVSLGLTQPLLQGAGVTVNQVPIMLARIDAESSYFRLKDGVQETVRGVIQAYWDLVAARTLVWATEQQVTQAEFAFRLESARNQVGISNQGQLAQARLALASFRANLISAQSSLLDREAALRGILGLPPTDSTALLPMTAPVTQPYEFDWEGLLTLAEQYRPDIIEQKLILEADYQQLLLATNQTLPQLDAVARYRWNGLEGELPIGRDVRSPSGEFTDWQIGINFSVPLGQRRARALLREQELILARDRANLDQAMLEAVHEIAATLRRIDLQFSRYEALRETRIAAVANLRQQLADFRQERIDFINVLQALTDWGNAVSSEASSLAQYNAELATLERETGTILESHGIRFYEERYAAAGPLGIYGPTRCYPRAQRMSANESRYPEAASPVDEQFREGAPPGLFDRKPADRPRREYSPGDGRLPPPEPVPTPRQTPPSPD